jgi:hypothetical protein
MTPGMCCTGAQGIMYTTVMVWILNVTQTLVCGIFGNQDVVLLEGSRIFRQWGLLEERGYWDSVFSLSLYFLAARK